MPLYAYRARSELGTLVRGTLEAPSAGEAAKKLQKMSYFVVGLHPTAALPSLPAFQQWFERVGAEDLILFTLQVSDLVAAGLTLSSSLNTLEKQTENRKFKHVIAELQRTLEAGQPFSAALENHPQVFSNLYVAMVKAGEASGNLDGVMKRLSQFLEAQQEFRRRVVAAVTYPAILLAASLGVILLVVTWIVPSFVDLFTSAGVPLPWPTRLLSSIGHFLTKDWYWPPPLLTVSLIFFRRWARTPSGRFKFHRFLGRLPRLGDLLRKEAVSRLSDVLALLVSSGVPLLESLVLTEKAVGNAVMEQMLRSARQAVFEGQSLAQTFRVSGELPPDALQMIAVGEESGRLSGMLEKIAEIYHRAVDYSLRKFTALLEPLMLVFLGGVVAVIMLSVFLPILNMVSILRRGR